MSKNRFQGDPKIYITENGADFNFIAGQPDMDAGFENQAMISLFTSPNWWGNVLIDNAGQKIGSDFEEKAKGSVTLKKLAEIEQNAIRVLEYPAFGNIEATASNPESSRIDLSILISPQGQDVAELSLSRNAQNWKNQSDQGE